MRNQFSSLLDSPALSFTLFHALTDGAKAGFYPGVLIIEKGPAKGHYAVKEGNRVVNFDPGNPDHASLQKYPIHIDEDTLSDVVRCGNSSKKTKCKLDHGTTVRDIVGNYAGFRLDGDKVRADLALLNSSSHRAYVEELISEMSEKIGNSIDFDYQYEIKGNVAVARCVKLNSVDLVDTPAATNSLFNLQPEQTYMPLSKEDLEAIGTVVDTKLAAHKTEMETRFSAIQTKLEEKEEPEKKEEEGEGDKKELASMVKTTVLAAIKEAMPTLPVPNLSSAPGGGKDQYTEKLEACRAAGISDAKAKFHIARTWPEVYNAKFGAGSAAATTNL